MVGSLEGEEIVIPGIGSEIKAYTHASYVGAGDETQLYYFVCVLRCYCESTTR